jgi:hypothetical protein
MLKSSKNNMENWLHMQLPKVTKTAFGPLGVKTFLRELVRILTNLTLNLK